MHTFKNDCISTILKRISSKFHMLFSVILFLGLSTRPYGLKPKKGPSLQRVVSQWELSWHTRLVASANSSDPECHIIECLLNSSHCSATQNGLLSTPLKQLWAKWMWINDIFIDVLRKTARVKWLEDLFDNRLIFINFTSLLNHIGNVQDTNGGMY